MDEVNQMVEQGILGEDEHVELLDGELVIMSPLGPPHAALVADLVHRLTTAYDGKGHVRPQLPLEVRPHSIPEPDLAVVRGEPRDFRQRHPVGRDVLLVVEVARTIQQIDRKKIRIYAIAGVRVYWLIDLPKNQIEVFRTPSADGTYAERTVYKLGQEIPVPDLDLRWPVSDLIG